MPEPKICGCGKTLSRKNKSGRCLKCSCKDPAVIAKKSARTPEQKERQREVFRRFSADPAIVAKRTAAMLHTMATDPAAKARHKAACAAGKAKQMEDPDALHALRESGRRVGETRFWDGLAPERLGEERRKRRASRLAWCPEQFWELNQTLKAKGFRLAERKEMILAEVKGTAEHARRQIANITDAQRIRAAREKDQLY